jgi:hypothetical protein
MTAIIAVITNAGIMCFTMELIPFTSWGQVWLFIGFQYVIFIAMAIFAYLVDDVPEDVAIQLQRQEYLRERAEMTDEERTEEKTKGKTGSRPVQTNIPESLLSVREYFSSDFLLKPIVLFLIRFMTLMKKILLKKLLLPKVVIALSVELLLLD